MALGRLSYWMIWPVGMRTHLCHRRGPSRGISWSKRGRTHPQRRRERAALLHLGLLQRPQSQGELTALPSPSLPSKGRSQSCSATRSRSQGQACQPQNIDARWRQGRLRIFCPFVSNEFFIVI